jgi:hypothetical protein
MKASRIQERGIPHGDGVHVQGLYVHGFLMGEVANGGEGVAANRL